MPAGSIVIRKFEAKDRQALRSITYDNAFMGEPAAIFFDGEKILSDALTLYFTDYEPESCFVAQVNAEVVGCLLGAKNKIASQELISRKIGPALLREALLSGVFLRKKNIIFLFSCLSGMLRGEFKMPDFNPEYPATLHINIRKEFRGLGIGSGLIAAYLRYLKDEGVVGVHLATMSEGAARFFAKQGFQLLHEGRRSYFRHILHKDILLYIYGKKL